MKTITMILEASPDCFGAYSSNGEGIYGMGDTVEECKRSVLEAIAGIKEGFRESNIPEVLKGDYRIVYEYDMQSLSLHGKHAFAELEFA